MEEDRTYSLKEAAALLGIPQETLKTRYKRGEVPAILKQRGKRPELHVTQATLSALLGKTSFSSYEDLIARWKNEMASGYHSGKPMQKKSIECNLAGLRNYWRFLGQKPSIVSIRSENLRRALTNVPIDKEARKCHFALKEHTYKAVCSFAKFLIREKLFSQNEFLLLKEQKPKRVFPAVRKSLKIQDVGKLLTVCESRNGRTATEQLCGKAAVMLMLHAGLRRAEVASLHLSNVDFENGLIQVIDGKGHKNRLVGMSIELEQVLNAWLEQRPSSPYPHFLLNSKNKPLTGNAIRFKVERLAKRAGLDISPHGLRRTCATLASDRGVPVEHIRQNLGHSDLKTTQESYLMTDALVAARSFRELGKKEKQSKNSKKSFPLGFR